MTEEEKLFARKASGLIKEASATKAAFFNIANIMGSKFAWSVAYLGLFPAGLILGWPPYLLICLMIGLLSYITAILYIQFTTPMPRSGADYVIPARILGPFWGFINSWMIVWSWLPVWGWMAWVTVRNFKQLLDVLSIVNIIQGPFGYITSSPMVWILGILTIVFAMILCILPPRRYYTILSALAVFSIIGLILTIVGVVIGMSTFESNFQRYLGYSTTELVNRAIENGWDPNETLTFNSLIGLLGYVLFVIGGYQYSATISGEIKGDVKKGLTISIIGSLTFFMLYQIPFVWLILTGFGYRNIIAWSYLFWNTDIAPFGLPPINALICTIGTPNLWPLWFIAGVAGVFGTWLCIPASMVYINRQIFAWGIDRMVPKTLADVHPRLHQPMKIFILEGLVGTIFFATTITGVNPVSYALWTTLLMSTSLIFPGIIPIVMKKRRPDLYRAVPWKKAFVPLGILQLAWIIPVYLIAGVYGSAPITPEMSLWSWAITTGLVATLVVIIAGVIIYYSVRAWNIKQGIEFDKMFKLIPPE